MKKWIAIVFLSVLVVSMVLVSGCTSSQPTVTSTTTSRVTAIPTTYQPLSDHDIVQQGIASAEKICIDYLPRDAPTDKCVMAPENQEKMINLIVQNITAAEQHCEKVLPRSKDLSECTISDTRMSSISSRTKSCMENRETTISNMNFCLNVQIYHFPWYDTYYLN
jgi:hypothetical protein